MTFELVDMPRHACGLHLTRRPHPKQAAFLALDCREAFFAGAAGAGKTDALLLAALQYVCVPGYSAILLRRTAGQLADLIDRAEEWLAATDAEWSASEMRWTFPSGARLRFGHAELDADRLRYAGDEFQFVGFDELAMWPTPKVYLYVGFGRVRRPATAVGRPACRGCGSTVADVPLRTRGASNPVGPGVGWVRTRFAIQLDGELPTGRRFMPAAMHDNPALDTVSYTAGLDELDPVERARLLAGDWTVSDGGTIFERGWFDDRVRFRDVPLDDCAIIRAWDLAATAPSRANRDPDWTAGCLLAVTIGRTPDHSRGEWYLLSVDRIRATPAKVEQFLWDTHVHDDALCGRRVPIRVELEGGSGGRHTIDQLQRGRFVGVDLAGRRPRAAKAERARPAAVAAEAGHVHLVNAGWCDEFCGEAQLFGSGHGHDDQIDAFSLAFHELAPHARTGAAAIPETVDRIDVAPTWGAVGNVIAFPGTPRW